MKTLLLALAALAAGAPALAQTDTTANNLWDSYRESRALGVPPGLTLQKLITISSDRDSQVARMSLMIDDSSSVAGLYKGGQRSFISTPSLLGDDGVLWLREIESNEGAVLIEGQNRKIILVQGKLKRETQEGRFQVRYLANALSNTYEACDMLLKRDDKGGWYIQNAYTRRKVASAKVTTWSLGVTTIEGICPKEPKRR